jgi:beta-N-acetylhexosaminidase
MGTAKGGLPYTTTEETHNRVVVIVFSDDVRMTAGRVFERQMRARVPDANVLFVDPRIAEGMTDDVLHAIHEAQVVVAAVYAAPVPGGMRNSTAVPDATGTLLTKMVEHARKKMAVVALGSPYVVAGFPEIQNYLCTFSNETVSELSAVKALFGEIPIRGHLPVSIPNVAERGAGIERQARVASGEVPHAHTEISRR